MTATLVTVVAAVALLAVLVVALVRAQARLTRRVDALAAALAPAGPPAPPRRADLVGTPAAALLGVDLGGHPVDVRWAQGRRCLVAFMTGSCSTCRPFWDGLAEGRPLPAGVDVVVVTPDPTMESRRGLAARAPAATQVVMSSPAWLSYGVGGAPWFAVVADGMVVAEGNATSWDDLVGLIGP